MEIENLHPNVYKKCDARKIHASEENEDITDLFDEREVFGETH